MHTLEYKLVSQDQLSYQTWHKNIQPTEEGYRTRLWSPVFIAEIRKQHLVSPKEDAQRFIHLILTIPLSLAPFSDIH